MLKTLKKKEIIRLKQRIGKALFDSTLMLSIKALDAKLLKALFTVIAGIVINN